MFLDSIADNRKDKHVVDEATTLNGFKIINADNNANYALAA